MYKKIAILLIAVLVLLCAIQPASAAGGAIASKLAGFKPTASASATPHPSPPPGVFASKLADIRSHIENATVRSSAAIGARAGEARLQATKTVVTDSIESAINSLNRFTTNIDNSKLTDGQKAVLKSQVQDNVSWFEGKISDVQASTDVAGVLANASDASDRWNSVLPGLKRETGFMATDNVDSTIATARNASSVISSRIDSLKAQGKDTSALEAALASYNGHVDSAAGHAANARSEFSSIGGKNDGHYAAGMVQLNQAANDMKGAYSDLKTIYRLAYGVKVQVN